MLLNLIASPLKELPEGLLLEGLEQSKTCKQALTMPCDSPLALSLRLSCPPFWGSVCYHDNHGSQQVTFETVWKKEPMVIGGSICFVSTNWIDPYSWKPQSMLKLDKRVGQLFCDNVYFPDREGVRTCWQAPFIFLPPYSTAPCFSKVALVCTWSHSINAYSHWSQWLLCLSLWGGVSSLCIEKSSVFSRQMPFATLRLK